MMAKKKKRRSIEEIRKEILKFFESQTFPRTTGQIARAVGLNWYSMSHHLALMKADGLLFHEKVGKQNQWWPENISKLTDKVRNQEREIGKLRKQCKRIPELENEIQRLRKKD